MGRNSRAKQGARQERVGRPHAGAAAAAAGGDTSAQQPHPLFRSAAPADAAIAQLVIRELKAAVDRHGAGYPGTARRYGERLTSGDFATAPRAVDVAIARALQSAVELVWPRGWLPADVHEITGRRAPGPAVSLVVDAMAADVATYTPQTVDPRWFAQLESVDASVWWEAGRPHLSQWVARHRIDRATALATVVELIAMLSTLPVVPTLLARPGHARATGPARVGVDEKMLGRVRALLAKAESTGFPEEAESLSAKAQELMSRYAIERAVLDAGADQVALPGARRVWLEQPYVSAKSSLVGAVAAANRCRAVGTLGLGFVTVIGDELDLQIVELLTTSLMVQATAAMVGSGARTNTAGQSRTRSFRHAFLLAYAGRIGERLRARADETVATAGRELVPVFAERERVIGETFEAMFPRVRSKSFSVTNGAGWAAGRAAADSAVLHVGRETVTGR